MAQSMRTNKRKREPKTQKTTKKSKRSRKDEESVAEPETAEINMNMDDMLVYDKCINTSY